MNDHDLEGLLGCFHPDYQSEHPVHPDRNFRGIDQVRRNWSTLFAALPDFRAELIGEAVHGRTHWAEWRWLGTRSDGGRVDLRGVTLLGVEDGRFVWGRLYMEPVEESGSGIDGAGRTMARSSPQAGAPAQPEGSTS
jgi:ketosteroid isomerase-like protein